MKRSLTTFLVILGFVIAACGGDSTPVATGAGDDGEPISVEADDGVGDGAEPLPLEEPDVADIEESVITNGDIVDPMITTPAEVLLNPDDPAELWVRFTGGDPNCTAANATLLTETTEAIAVELQVGITQDALARSCVAGEFNLRVDVTLRESGEGKAISWTQPAGDEAPLVTPDLSTDDFVGLTQAEAEAIAEENLIPNRIGRIDGEFFDLTEDFNPGRLTFEVDDGIVTLAVLG